MYWPAFTIHLMRKGSKSWRESAKIVEVDLELRHARVCFEYQSRQEACVNKDPNILFKAGTIVGDKLYVCEAGSDVAGMDILPGAPARMSAINAFERAPVKLLASVLHARRPQPGDVRESRLLTAATLESCQSA